MVTEAYLYTDGACDPNPGKGGWGYIALDHELTHIAAMGYSERTTNNQMEMQALIEGLTALFHKAEDPGAIEVVVMTDSKYLIDGTTKWIKGWKAFGWKTKSGDPVKNKELWQKIDNLKAAFGSVEFQWVKGHSGNLGNEIADFLATAARDASVNQELGSKDCIELITAKADEFGKKPEIKPKRPIKMRPTVGGTAPKITPEKKPVREETPMPKEKFTPSPSYESFGSW